MAGVAFFDLDRTLIAVNSASGWVRRELRLGHVGWLEAMRAAGWIGLYGLGVANMGNVVRSAVATLRGTPEDEIRRRTLAFWEEEVRAQLRPGARAAVERHREAGDRLVLLTSSSPYMSEPIAAELGLDDWLCNRFEVVDGVFTGETLEPLCFGAGKIEHARAYVAERGVALTDCAFYTDSMSDLPMLELVGRPVVIDPDPRLAREAKRRGWPVEDWGGVS